MYYFRRICLYLSFWPGHISWFGYFLQSQCIAIFGLLMRIQLLHDHVSDQTIATNMTIEAYSPCVISSWIQLWHTDGSPGNNNRTAWPTTDTTAFDQYEMEPADCDMEVIKTTIALTHRRQYYLSHTMPNQDMTKGIDCSWAGLVRNWNILTRISRCYFGLC